RREVRAEPGAVEQVKVRPPADERRRVARLEMAKGRLDEVEHRRDRSVLHGRAVRDLRYVPARGDAVEVLTEEAICRPRLRAGEHVEVASSRKLERRVRKRLGVTGEPARRPADAFRDHLDLAEMAREEREDAVRLTEVQRLEDD